MRILIADDDPTYRALLSDLLEQWGYEPLVCEDGEQAMDALQGPTAPNLAIVDWMMPGLDGFELCRRVREMDGGGDVYILLATGSRLKEEIIRVVVAGADDYIIKPFEPQDLQIRLRAAQRILDLRHEVRQLQCRLESGANGSVPTWRV